MSVHRLKDGRWVVRWLDDGKHRASYFGRGIEAEAKAREFNATLGLRDWQKHTPDEGAAVFVDLVQAYIAAKRSVCSPVSLKNLEWKMLGVILPELGGLRATSITPARLDAYVAGRMRSVKNTTIHRELSDIKAVLSWALKRRYIPINPAAGYEMPKRDDAIISPPTADEMTRIMRHSPERLKRAIMLSYFTGLRPGAVELYGLTWDDVDFEARSILVRSAKKGGAPSRSIPIHDDFIWRLKAWAVADDGRGFIVNYRGARVESLKKSFARAKERAKVGRRLRLYDIRHAFATILISGGADMRSVADLMGHTRPDTTMRIYAHSNRAARETAMSKLPALDFELTPGPGSG
jgi:integrase